MTEYTSDELETTERRCTEVKGMSILLCCERMGGTLVKDINNNKMKVRFIFC